MPIFKREEANSVSFLSKVSHFGKTRLQHYFKTKNLECFPTKQFYKRDEIHSNFSHRVLLTFSSGENPPFPGNNPLDLLKGIAMLGCFLMQSSLYIPSFPSISRIRSPK